MASVTGTTKSTVVTLSSNEDTTAVVSCSISRMPAGLAFTFCVDHIARYSNMPERRVIDTRIIMPVSRPMVFQSMPLSASFWSSAPMTTITDAPRSATIARLSLSHMMPA
jgi:hypothetical protein